MLHLEEPLHGKLRFNGHVGTFGETYLIGVGLDLLQQPGIGQVLFNLLAHVKTIHTYVDACTFGNRPIVIKNVNALQVVFFTQHIVIYVMGRSHLQASCAKLHVNVFILNDRNNAIHQRHDDFLAAQPVSLRVVRINAHGRVSHDGLRTRCSYHCIAAALRVAMYHFFLIACFAAHVIISHIVLKVIELAMFFFVDYLLITQSCQRLGVPVDHAHAPINKPFVIEVDKHFDDAPASFLVHGEGGTVPVARCSQPA